MNINKHFEIRLSLIQMLLSLCALGGCIFLAFILGAFIGSRFIQSSPRVASLPQPFAASAPVPDYRSFEPLHPPPGDDPGTRASDMTFYEDLQQKVEITPSPEKKPLKAETAPAAPSADAAGPEKPPAQAPPETAYTIQIAAFLQKEKAYALANTLISQGFSAQVVSKTNPQGQTWHRVRVGSFKSPEEAKQLLKRLGQLESQPRITTAD